MSKPHVYATSRITLNSGHTLICDVIQDDVYRSPDEVFCDEPVALCRYGYRGYGASSDTIHDNTKLGNVCIDARLARAIDRNNLDQLCDYFDNSWYETIRLPDGRYKLTGRYLERPRYYKDSETCFAGILRIEGLPTTLKVERLSAQGDDYYLMWDQDAYAGMLAAEPPVETAQAWLEGDIYGYVIREEDEAGNEIDDHLESCWGCIGDIKYCLEEGEIMMNWLASERNKEHDAIKAEQNAYIASIYCE